MPEDMRIPCELRIYRYAYKLSSAELAKRVGLRSDTSIYEYESGKVIPSRQVRERISAVLGIAIDKIWPTIYTDPEVAIRVAHADATQCATRMDKFTRAQKVGTAGRAPHHRHYETGRPIDIEIGDRIKYRYCNSDTGRFSPWAYGKVAQINDRYARIVTDHGWSECYLLHDIQHNTCQIHRIKEE